MQTVTAPLSKTDYTHVTGEETSQKGPEIDQVEIEVEQAEVEQST